jgi:hypothetical protein
MNYKKSLLALTVTSILSANTAFAEEAASEEKKAKND